MRAKKKAKKAMRAADYSKAIRDLVSTSRYQVVAVRDALETIYEKRLEQNRIVNALLGQQGDVAKLISKVNDLADQINRCVSEAIIEGVKRAIKARRKK
jgi:hypothetical protein